MARHREKQAKLPDSNVTGNATVTDGNGTDIELDIELDIEEDIDKDIDKDIKKEHIGADAPSSKKTPNKYNIFFETYNNQKIVIHQNLTQKMKQAIDSALKKDSQEDILKAIERYGEAFRDKNYRFCKYKMTLDKFLTQSNGYYDWLDEGQKWINYNDFKKQGGLREKANRKHKSDDGENGITEQAGILSF